MVGRGSGSMSHQSAFANFLKYLVMRASTPYLYVIDRFHARQWHIETTIEDIHNHIEELWNKAEICLYSISVSELLLIQDFRFSSEVPPIGFEVKPDSGDGNWNSESQPWLFLKPDPDLLLNARYFWRSLRSDFKTKIHGYCNCSVLIVNWVRVSDCELGTR